MKLSSLTPNLFPIPLQDQEPSVGDERSPNSSVTLETSSTPEFLFCLPSPPLSATIIMFSDPNDASEDETHHCPTLIQIPSTMPSSTRELPWSKNGVSSYQNGVHHISTTGLNESVVSQENEKKDSATTDAEESLASTPPVTPVAESSDDEDVVSLRVAIASTLTRLRSKSLSFKGILKRSLNTPVNTQKTGISPSTSVIEEDDTIIEEEATCEEALDNPPTVESCIVSFKKRVRWNLSEEQELKESQKPHMPMSPSKLHAGNRIIHDPSEDELMSVHSDDFPTPPVSPNSYDEHISLHIPVLTRNTSIDFEKLAPLRTPSMTHLPSLTVLVSSPKISPIATGENSPLTATVVKTGDEMTLTRTSSTSNLFARKASHMVTPTSETQTLKLQVPLPIEVHTPPPTLLMRSNSSSSLPLLRRAKSQSLGNSLRANMKANERILTAPTMMEEEEAEVKEIPGKQATAALSRSISDFQPSFILRSNRKKRLRAERTEGGEDEEEEEAILANRPKSKLQKQQYDEE